MIPPDAAERFAFEKNVDSRKDRAIVAIPYIVKNVNMTRGSALLSTFPYWNKKYLNQHCFTFNNADDQISVSWQRKSNDWLKFTTGWVF